MNPREQLLAVELSDQEVRTLLERLGESELPDAVPTVGAVAEVTGADPAILGRMLAQMRKERFEEEWGLRISRLEGRMLDVEEDSEELEREAGLLKKEVENHKRRLDHLESGNKPPILTSPKPVPTNQGPPIPASSKAEYWRISVHDLVADSKEPPHTNDNDLYELKDAEANSNVMPLVVCCAVIVFALLLGVQCHPQPDAFSTPNYPAPYTQRGFR